MTNYYSNSSKSKVISKIGVILCLLLVGNVVFYLTVTQNLLFDEFKKQVKIYYLENDKKTNTSLKVAKASLDKYTKNLSIVETNDSKPDYCLKLNNIVKPENFPSQLSISTNPTSFKFSNFEIDKEIDSNIMMTNKTQFQEYNMYLVNLQNSITEIELSELCQNFVTLKVRENFAIIDYPKIDKIYNTLSELKNSKNPISKLNPDLSLRYTNLVNNNYNLIDDFGSKVSFEEKNLNKQKLVLELEVFISQLSSGSSYTIQLEYLLSNIQTSLANSEKVFNKLDNIQSKNILNYPFKINSINL